MKKIIIIVLVIFCVQIIYAQNEAIKEIHLNDAQKAYALSKLCTEIKYNFVYYDKLTFDWDSLCIASIPTVLATKTIAEYCNEMRKICARLGDGHTYVYEYNLPDPQDWISPLPMVTKTYGKRVFVDKVYSKELKGKGLVKGAEILKINGKNIHDYGKEDVMPYLTSSTPQWLDYYTFNTVELTKGRKRDLVKVQYKDANGKIHEHDISRNLDWDEWEERKTFHYKVLPDNIGFLHITTFMDHNSNTLFDQLYEQLRSTDALIIDLRGNSGGNSGYADYILRHFSEKPFKSSQWSSRMYIPAHASWNYPDEWYTCSSNTLTPVNKEIYTKPVIVLTNAGTFSSAEDFCIKFRGMKRGMLIGKPTGGSTGNGVQVTLIDGVLGASICSKKDIGPDGTVFVGIGILPDIEAEETIDDYLNAKDPVLEKAIQLLKK
ncbi:MAG: peptidase S41 [Prevotellaceae bacterium]|jgi:C-terminal processing protease CtpA/Prc|nr:peptidase S41 [Prevotellaceae bacterium]